MSRILIPIAVIAITITTGTASADTVSDPAYGTVTAGYRPKTGEFCIRSGWGHARPRSVHQVRKGDCHSAADWRRRGLRFDAPENDASMAIATR